MHTLIAYDENTYPALEKACRNNDLTPIPVFPLTLAVKQKNKEAMEKLRLRIQKLQNRPKAVLIELEALDNATISTIHFLRKDFDLILLKGGLNRINRYALESCDIDALVDPQNESMMKKHDFIHHFNSGINHILMKMAKENDIAVLQTLDFAKLPSRLMAKEIGRISQNIMLCRKYKVPFIITPIVTVDMELRKEEELRNIGRLLNLSTQQNSESLEFLEKRIQHNTFKKSPIYIRQGIEILQ